MKGLISMFEGKKIPVNINVKLEFDAETEVNIYTKVLQLQQNRKLGGYLHDLIVKANSN